VIIIGAIVAFALAVIFELAGLGKGHLTATTFMLIGLLLLALHLAGIVWPRSKA
jgi:hypothetical protein